MDKDVAVVPSLYGQNKYFAFADGIEYELKIEHDTIVYYRTIPKTVLTEIQFELDIFKTRHEKKYRAESVLIKTY